MPDRDLADNVDVRRSAGPPEDEGESWDYHFFPKHHEDDGVSYCRAVVVKADDPDVMFVANGDGIPGTHPQRADVVVAVSLYGYVYVTEDAGDSWNKLEREFGEVRAVAVTPN